MKVVKVLLMKVLVVVLFMFCLLLLNRKIKLIKFSIIMCLVEMFVNRWIINENGLMNKLRILIGVRIILI